jgi:hypothetical protein
LVRPSSVSNSASTRSVCLSFLVISSTFRALASITSIPHCSAKRLTQGEWPPASITSRQPAWPSNSTRKCSRVILALPEASLAPSPRWTR